jgi:hypothetical protein
MATTVAFGDQEFASLRLQYSKEKAKRGLDVPYRLAKSFLEKAKSDREGGKKTVVDWAIRRHSQTQQLDSGYESLTLVANPTLKSGYFEDRLGIRPILLGLRDVIENRGTSQRIDLIAERMVDNDMARLEEFEQAVMLGTLASWSDLVPLNGADNTDGILEAAAVGSQTNVVHTLSKATFAALPGFNNQYQTAGDDFSVNGINAVDEVILRCRNRALESVDHRAYVSLNFAMFWWRVFQPQERFVSADGPLGGKSGSELEFLIRNIKTCVSNTMPNAGTNTTANPWSFVLVDHNMIGYDAQKGYLQERIPLQAMWGAGSPAKVGYDIDCGQLVCRYFGTSGVVDNGETY